MMHLRRPWQNRRPWRVLGLATACALLFWALAGTLPGAWLAAPAPAVAQQAGSINNLRLLSMAVCGEARGEPYEGKVAVAAVLINRVKSKKFPNTVAGVVYQPLAFESVSNGEIYKAVTPECQRAARDALNGWDPTWGSLYFFAPAKTRNKFIWSREQVRTIGKHIFAR